VHVVAAAPGKPEPLVVGLIRCERGVPDPKEGVANLFSERVDLRRIVARPRGVVENLVESVHSAHSAHRGG